MNVHPYLVTNHIYKNTGLKGIIILKGLQDYILSKKKVNTKKYET